MESTDKLDRVGSERGDEEKARSKMKKQKQEEGEEKEKEASIQKWERT
jgi:hypothetical protein